MSERWREILYLAVVPAVVGTILGLASGNAGVGLFIFVASITTLIIIT